MIYKIIGSIFWITVIASISYQFTSWINKKDEEIIIEKPREEIKQETRIKLEVKRGY